MVFAVWRSQPNKFVVCGLVDMGRIVAQNPTSLCVCVCVKNE